MKGIWFLISLVVLILLWHWWSLPCYVTNVGICRVAPLEIKTAMRKMGPYYDYRIKEGKLYVNRGDNKWMRLRY